MPLIEYQAGQPLDVEQGQVKHLESGADTILGQNRDAKGLTRNNHFNYLAFSA